MAVARLYPQINLSANFGSQSLTSGTQFGTGSEVWGLARQLTQPLFDPGQPAEKRAALAAFDAAAANFQGVVLEALRGVVDTLRSMEREYRFGAASYLQLLVAQQQSHQTRLGLVVTQAQRLADSVALYQAIGAI